MPGTATQTLTLAVALAVAVASRTFAQQPAQWRLVEVWRVGGALDGAHAFHDVRDVDVFPDGRIAVLDVKTMQVHILGARGDSVKSFGRAGGGPGEFTYPNGIAIAPSGQFVVHDPQASRLTLFSTRGEFVRTVPIPARGTSLRWPGYFSRDGRVIERVIIRATERRVGGAERAPVVTARSTPHRWTADFARSDTVPLLDCGDPRVDLATTFFLFQSDSLSSTRDVPFLPSDSYVDARDGFAWTHRADGELVRRALGSCDVVARIRLGGRRPPVPMAIRAAQEDTVRTIAARFRMAVPDLDRIPRMYPWYDRLRVDDVGRLWVERHGDRGLRHEVYSPAGTLLATIDNAPVFPAFRPVAITRDHVYAFVPDADDVLFLIGLRIATDSR